MLGSGKSTAAGTVAAWLGYNRRSTGDFVRSMAIERGITLAELNKLAETDPEIDRKIDQIQKEYMDENDNFVIDARIGWFFAPDSFKVFLSLDLDTAASRVFADIQAKKAERKGEISNETLEQIKQRLSERLASEKERYKKYYGIEDYQDPKHFDLVIDTKANGIDQVREKIIEGYKKWQQN